MSNRPTVSDPRLLRRRRREWCRRILILPTARLEAIGHEYLRMRIEVMRQHGFVWTGAADAGTTTAIDPA